MLLLLNKFRYLNDIYTLHILCCSFLISQLILKSEVSILFRIVIATSLSNLFMTIMFCLPVRYDQR